MSTKVILLLVAAALLLAVAGEGARAGQTIPLSGQLDLDLRAADSDGPSAGVYSLSVNVQGALNPNTTVQVTPVYRYSRLSLQTSGIAVERGSSQVSAGIVQIPFGIYNEQETYASGLIDYPLLRGGYSGYALDWWTPGAAVNGGPPKLRYEVAGFFGHGVDDWNFGETTRGSAERVQTYFGDLIVGVSRWDGSLGDTWDDWGNKVSLSGIDIRYTRPQLVLRGEYAAGGLSGSMLHGGYLDGYYRIPGIERLTLAARAEELLAEAGTSPVQRYTFGARWRIRNGLTASANIYRQAGGSADQVNAYGDSVDGGETFTAGLVQLYDTATF